MADATSFFTDGAAYERLMGRWSRAVGEVFVDWLSPPQGLRWLDVGCGTGAFTELVIDRCRPKQISAIDPAEDQITYARSRPAAAGATFRVGDAQSLPYSDDEFDVAAMALVITFIPEPAKAVAEMKRVVKPGGTLGSYIWDFLGKGYTQQPLRDAIEAMGIGVPLTPGHHNSRLEKLTGFFEAAGLDQIRARTIEIEVSYKDFDEYWFAETALKNSVVQHIGKMTTPEIEKLKATLRERLPKDRNGRIAYKAKANAVKARVPL
jgi:ubiquinone/menaquinone biosynthesis C-methylase UbiE